MDRTGGRIRLRGALSLDAPAPGRIRPGSDGGYTERGATLASLRNAPVHRAGRLVGSLGDLRVKADGEVEAQIFHTKDGPIELPYDDRVTLAPVGVRVAS